MCTGCSLAVGNLLTAGDANSQYTFTYDELSRQTSSDNAGTPGVPHVVLTSAYDAAGNRTSVQDDAGVSVSSSYDARNLLSSRIWSGGVIDPARIDFSYNGRGDVTDTRRFADLGGTNLISHSTLSYDVKGRLNGITHRDGTDAVVADYTYVHD